MKRIFTALISVPAMISYDVEIEWNGDEEPTEAEVVEAYLNGNKAFKFTQNEIDETSEGLEASDICEEG